MQGARRGQSVKLAKKSKHSLDQDLDQDLDQEMLLCENCVVGSNKCAVGSNRPLGHRGKKHLVILIPTTNKNRHSNRPLGHLLLCQLPSTGPHTKTVPLGRFQCRFCIYTTDGHQNMKTHFEGENRY